jgi:cell division protein ZapA
MSDKRHVVKVSIVGEEYTIRSDETPEHTRAVAHYVDSAIRQVLTSSSVLETQRAAIMAALQITDELFKLRQSNKQMETGIEALSAEVRRWLPPAKRGDTGEQLSLG